MKIGIYQHPFFKQNLACIKLIALWYKNYNSLLGKRASVTSSSFLSVRCPKFQLGKDWIVNKRLQKTFRRAVTIPSHLFFWAGVLVTWSVQHRSGSLNYTCSSCHTWIGIVEYWLENEECSGWNEWLLTSWSYLLTINTYTLQEKTSLPPSIPLIPMAWVPLQCPSPCP